MSRTQYTYLNQSITTSPQAITFSGLSTSDEGNALPAFSNAPQVMITAVRGDGYFYVSSITTTGFTVNLGSVGADLPISIDFVIESRETTTPSAGAAGTAVTFPYYCSIDDVQDWLVNLKQSFGITDNLNLKRRRRFIAQAYGAVNGALKKGGYDVPQTLSSRTTLAAGVSASDTVVTVSVADDSIFTVGDTVRIHGQSGSNFYDEFAVVVNADDGADTIVLESLENSYNSGSTIEVCSDGYMHLRKCNAVGAASFALLALGVAQGRVRNEKVISLNEMFKDCLKQIEDGALDDLDRNLIIESYQTLNTDDAQVTKEPLFTTATKF